MNDNSLYSINEGVLDKARAIFVLAQFYSISFYAKTTTDKSASNIFSFLPFILK